MPMMMRFNHLLACGLIGVTQFVMADKAHEVFAQRQEAILSEPVTVSEGIVFLVGEAISPARRGDAVGWGLAEANAKWALGERHREASVWATDVTEDEKDAAWIVYRSAHPERFSITGLQRIWSEKPSEDAYCLVLAVPESCVDMTPPKASELADCVKKVRERRKKASEIAEVVVREVGQDTHINAEKGNATGSKERLGDKITVQQQASDEMLF